MVLSGNKLAGGNPANNRIDNDFYATDPTAVNMLLNTHDFFWFKNMDILEPCVGQGHIIEAVKNWCDYINIKPYIHTLDIVDRGYPNTEICDFLTWEPDQQYDMIITNPPYSLATEFIEKSMECLRAHGQMAMFLKIQFLEGQKRENLFKEYPPEYIYVFRNRMATWNNGQPLDPKTGKKWATTMCHAWFIWEKGSTTEPIVRWL